MKVGFVSLGCSKNLIDTEVAIGKLKKHNFEIVNDPNKADIIIINTCGFIESAKEEAVNTILEMAEYKKKNCEYLIAMGCLVQRYKDELEKSLPEVDLFIKIEDYDKLWDMINNLIRKEDIKKNDKNNSKNKIENKNKVVDSRSKIKQIPMFMKEEYLQREVSTGKNYAYLKVGEGCSNMCTYCAIPYIRGLFISRPLEDILSEAEMLVKQGTKELIVIAQDTTKYGIDIYGKSKIADLLEKLAKIEGVHWIRLLYTYPEGLTDELIKVVKNNPKISKYFDIPIQHISNDILKKMNRKTSKDNIEKIISKIRKEIPDVTLRTSLIVGFPGETKKNFEELYGFVEETRFDKLGVFEYSREEGTPASTMPNQVHYKTKRYRREQIMELQRQISYEKMKEKIGKEIEVLIEGMSLDRKYYIGRTKSDVPEIDGVVYIKREKSKENDIKLDSFIKVKIIDIKDYDLVAIF